MFQKIKKYINTIISNKKFKKSIKREKRKLFIDDCFNCEKTFKKRKKVIIKLPDFSKIFDKENLKKIYIILSISSIIIILILLFSPLLNVKIIEIETDEKSKNLIDLNIAYKSVENYRNKNIFLLNWKDVWNWLINYQRNINKVEINKYFFSKKIKIILYSFDAIFITEINWKKYFVTNNWVFIHTNNKNIKNLKNITILLKDWYNEFFEYKKILKEDYLEKIIEIEKEITQNIVWLKIKSIFYFEKEKEVHFDINNDTKLIFDINTDTTDEQIKKLAIFNKDTQNIINSTNINYIDLRIPNKIFFCENTTFLSCKNNLKNIYSIYK